jgi:DNA polymerase-3 subunit epsilon
MEAHAGGKMLRQGFRRLTKDAGQNAVSAEKFFEVQENVRQNVYDRGRRDERMTKEEAGGFSADYCVLDTETTGLSAARDAVIEIGMLRVRQHEIVAEYSQIIQPGRRIDPFITRLTGITNEMTEGMPRMREVEDEVMAFLGEDVIVGHNISFDIRFLQAGFGHRLPNRCVDTVKLSRRLYPELPKHSLSALVAHLGLSHNAHRSLADCVATKELYEVMRQKAAAEHWTPEELWCPQAGHRRRF